MTTHPRTLLRWGLSLLLLGLVGRQLWAHWHALPTGVLTLSTPWLAAAFALMLLHLALSCEGWRRWVQTLGTPLSYSAAFRVLFVSNLSKYLPGGLWNYVDRGLLLNRYGASPAAAGASIALDLACQLAASALVGALAVSMVPGGPIWAGLWVATIALSMHPRLLNAGFVWAEAILKRPFPRLAIGYGRVLGMLAFYVLNWALLGSGFAALAQGLIGPPLVPGVAVTAAGSFTLAWALGTLTPLAPAGLGSREAALVVLLTPWMPAALPAVMAIAARIWLLVGEVVMFAIALLTHVPPVEGMQK